MATITFTTTFDLYLPTPKFEFEDTSTYVAQGIALADVNGCFTITSPSGAVIYTNVDYSNSGCNIRNSVSRFNVIDIALPLGADGMPEAGSYTVLYTVNDINTSTKYTATSTYTYAYVRPVVAITQSTDCVGPLFTSTDVTPYVIDGITPKIIRNHTITFPVGSGLDPVEGSDISIYLGFEEFANGTQSTTIHSELAYTFTDGLIVLDEITGYQSVQVDCGDVCGIFCCLRSIEQQMINYSTTNTALYAKTSALFNQMMSLAGFVLWARQCNKSTDISGALTFMKTIGNCTDDCSCSGTAPTLVTGLGGIVNNVVVQSGGEPLTVTSSVVGVVTTYTVTFSEILLDKLNNLYNTVVEGGDRITVTSSTTDYTTTYVVNAAPIVLSNNITPVSTSGAGTDALMSYVIPADTLAADGDVVKIEASYVMSGVTESKNVSFTLNGSNFISKLTPSPAVNTLLVNKDIKYYRVIISITRKSLTAVYITVDSYAASGNYIASFGYHLDEGAGAGYAVSDLSANTLTIACFGENYDPTSNTETITQNQLLVKYFNS